MQIYQRLDLVVLLVYVEAMVLTSTAYYSKWSEWDSWTTCNSFCGIGNTERRRQCEDVVGRVADGCGDEEDSIEIAECFTQRCPLGSAVPTWTGWLAWSACDKTCGDGVTYSTRACLKETARGPVFSTICPGKNERTETCLLELCPTQGTPQVEGFRDWTDWDEWSSCIGKCGQRFRYRECYTYGQKFSRGCYGQTEEWEACGIPSCPKVKATPRPIYGILDYAEWTVWEQWTHCGRTCGGGKKYRKRDCKNKRNINSVLSYTACGGPDVEDLKCNTQLCPGQTPKPKKVILGSWTEWATWARCSRSCVGGTTSRWRSCQDKKGNMVGDCKGEAMEYDDCGSALCTPAPFSSYGIPAPSIWPKNFAVWTEWEIWWDCTKTCGGGKTVRYRDCEENGKWMPGCPGTDTNRKECNTHSCSGQSAPPKPAKSPSSSQGSQSSSQSKSSTKQSTSGGAVSWASWSDWEKCSVSCDSGTRTRWRECNDANKNLASGCKGEYMDTGTCGSTPCQSASSSGSAKYSSSKSVSWASWSDWTKCSASCDGGSRSRWRECNDANRNLATGCEGEYMDDSDCGSSPCMSKSRTGAGDTPSRTGQSDLQYKSSPKQSSSGSEVKAWSTWSDWSSCSATCGGGTRSRWRECEGPNQSLAADCEGDYMDSGDCGSQSCQSSSRSGSNQVSQNTGGLDRAIEEGIGEGGGGGGEGGDDWGAWDSWQSCTVTCGVGVRMRYRQCVIESCLGEDVDSEDCVADELCEDSTAISEFEAEEGKGVVISCLDSQFVGDHPGSKVVWSKNEQPVEMNDRFILVDTADLEIKRVEPDDEGVYVCAVLSGDKTFNRHVVLLKIHSKSGVGGDSVMQMIIPASIPLVALIVIVVVVICQRRSGTKASGVKAKSKKAKVKKSKRAKSKKTVSAEVIEEEDYEPEAVPSRPGVPPPPPPPPLFSMNNSNAADEWIYFDGSPPPPPESPPPPPPTITPPPPPTIEPPPIPTFIPPPPTVAPPPPPTYAPLPRQHPSSRNNSNAGNDGVWSYSFSSWPPPFPP